MIRSSARRLGTLLAVALLAAALVAPNTIGRMNAAAFLRIPLELPVLLALLGVLPRRAAALAAPLLALALLVSLLVRLADVGAFEAFGRPFNPVLDAHLLGAGWTVLSGSVGTLAAALGLAAAAALAGIVFALLRWATATAGDALRGQSGRAAAAGALLLVLGLWAAGVTGVGGGALVTHEASRSLVDHTAVAIASVKDRAVFTAELGVDPVAAIPRATLFRSLAGKDVLLVFVESYGRSAVEGACCSARTEEALSRFEARLAEAGFSARTGYATSPVVGGQSWLPQATVLSGLEIGSQQRFEQLLASERTTMITDFHDAGWRTVAVMPAITRDWPEGRRFGYDAIYDSTTLGYRGKPFNWITMPDQYTLAALERLELGKARPRKPVMAEIALISSHAPWTPVPEVIDWADVGDGRVFDAQAVAGDPPDVVWRDPARVRAQYARSIAYSLDALSSFVLKERGRDLVILMLGDHQPAPLVTGEGAGRDVPVHILAKDASVTAAVARWGWTDGMVPTRDTPEMPMQALRERLATAFSAAAPQ